MKKLLRKSWNFLKGSHNPIWLTLLLTVSMSVISGLRTESLQRAQKLAEAREVAVKEYTLVVTEYTHQLFVVSNSLEDYATAFDNWYSALVGGTAATGMLNFAEAVRKSEDEYKKQDAELGHIILKVKAAEEQLLKITADIKVLKIMEDSPRSYISRVDYAGITKRFQDASPQLRAQLVKELQDIGVQLVTKLEKLGSIYREEYENAYSGFTEAIREQK